MFTEEGQQKDELAHIKNGTELGESLRNGGTRSGSGARSKREPRGMDITLTWRKVSSVVFQLKFLTAQGVQARGTISLTHPLPLDDEGKERESALLRTNH